jgi:hypothetical protein
MAAPLTPLVLAAALSAGPVPATLADAGFVAGRWVGDEDGAVSEETWSAPAGDAMLGTWRLVASGKTRVVELLSISAEGGTLVLRLRHFDPGLAAREEKDRPLVLPLVRRGDGALRFEGPRVDGGEGPVALTYERKGGGLVVTLEKDGKAQPFTFRRAP